MEDAGDDHADGQYGQHGGPSTLNPAVVQPGLSDECETQTHQTMTGPKRQCLYESRADRNDHQFG